MIQRVLDGIRKCIQKSVNYEKVKVVTQGEKENPALFHGQLVKAFIKYTNIDHSTSEGQSLLGQHFISQSASAIRQKLQKLQLGPQTSMPILLGVAFGVFNNQDQAEEEKRTQHEKDRPGLIQN